MRAALVGAAAVDDVLDRLADECRGLSIGLRMLCNQSRTSGWITSSQLPDRDSEWTRSTGDSPAWRCPQTTTSDRSWPWTTPSG